MSNAGSDSDHITLSPITMPSPESRRRSRCRRQIGGGVVLVTLLAAGGVWWGRSNGDDNKPVKHKATLPQSFAGYQLAKPSDSAWPNNGTVNTDPNKGNAWITYRAATGNKALLITMYLDPSLKEEPGDEDTALSTLFGTTVDTDQVKSYEAGDVGGEIKCATITVGQASFGECAWQNNAARVTLTVSVKNRTIVSEEAHSDLRSFLDAVKISPK